MKINNINNNSDNNTLDYIPEAAIGLGNRTIISGSNVYPRADTEIKMYLDLFTCKDILFRILRYFERGQLKDFRFVCQNVAQLTAEFWSLNKNLIQLYPINLITSKKGFINKCKSAVYSKKIISISKNNQNINEHKFQFLLGKNFQGKLLLSCNLDLYQFYNLLLSKETEMSFIQKAQTIASISVGHLNKEGVKIFKEILKEMSKQQQTFINLKILQTTNFADFTDCSIPNSIEVFQVCTMDLNICHLENLTNLKSIVLSSVTSLQIKNLPNLESITIAEQPFHTIRINRNECPRLASLTINGEIVPLDQSSEIILIEDVHHNEPDCDDPAERLLLSRWKK